ncbi:Peptidase M28 [Olavius algarvensis associated proteobacterium Delta 3]|nr:Peptidase M28 [Olavius algarvensis associated proteobacterium Delta 3]CAB5132013.1 Peptidase M28 [Olavius algarvensis associated proteobacterium Delta 3]
MLNIDDTIYRLKQHVAVLTKEIGERSVFAPRGLKLAADYIETTYRASGLKCRREEYTYHDGTMANIVAEASPPGTSLPIYLIGAHYDSVAGTVGADDNASAIAVQLELARQIGKPCRMGRAARFVSFPLEEPPVFGTPHMGSRRYAAAARKRGERIDGMICLEMVGYTCREPGCQDYPFPLMFLGYPKTGTFITVVGNYSSRPLTQKLIAAFRKNRELPAIPLTIPLGGYLVPAVRLSDHASFWDNGYRAVMITDTAFFRNPNYHLATDTMETLDFRFMAELVESLMLFFLA